MSEKPSFTAFSEVVNIKRKCHKKRYNFILPDITAFSEKVFSHGMRIFTKISQEKLLQKEKSARVLLLRIFVCLVISILLLFSWVDLFQK